MASQGAISKPSFNTNSGVTAPNIPAGGTKCKYASTKASDILGEERPTMGQVNMEDYAARVAAIETFVNELNTYVAKISPRIVEFVANHNAAVEYNESVIS
jgi:hypothetical protein